MLMYSRESTRALEAATDELARLDALCLFAPRAASIALRMRAIAALAHTGTKGTRALFRAFRRTEDGALPATPPEEYRWQTFLGEEERRARSGAFPSVSRLERSGVSIPRDAAARTENALRSSTPRLPALLRALDVAAAVPDHSLGEAAAALILCAEGRTDQIRLLPFDGVRGPARDEAKARWISGEQEAWIALGLASLDTRARHCRLAVGRLHNGLDAEDASLGEMGRAAITAREALAVLRNDASTSMPLLALSLGVSRPAAADALELLRSIGVVTEVTGRRRDRVYAWTAALAVADALASPDAVTAADSTDSSRLA